LAAAAISCDAKASAFSLVGNEAAEEGAAIDALARAWPRLPIRRVGASEADTYPDLSKFPLRDDPTIRPLSILPARVRLWYAAREAGCDVVLDGDGGDEIFSGFVTPMDAFRRGDLVSLWRHMRTRPNRRALALRSLFLPMMPLAIRNAWSRHWARSGVHMPAYAAPEAAKSAPIVEASAQFFGRLIHLPAPELVEEWLSWPTGIGAVATHDLIARELGLELASPLLDRRVVELVLGLAPSLMLSMGSEDKRFLREALRGRIPESVRAMAKNDRLAEAMSPRIVTSKSARRVLQDAIVLRRFDGLVRFEKLGAILDAIEHGHRPTEWGYWQLECVITLCDWYARAAREYGVD
jgi:asparagine synthetase B (glutamine-hydrolysing)